MEFESYFIGQSKRRKEIRREIKERRNRTRKIAQHTLYRIQSTLNVNNGVKFILY